MRGNWNVRRHEPSLEELTRAVEDLGAASLAALEEHGKYSREYINAEFDLRIVKRKLDKATYDEELRRASSKRTPSEIVDDVMGKR